LLVCPKKCIPPPPRRSQSPELELLGVGIATKICHLSIVASLLRELEEARKLALKLGQASAAVQCSMGKAKILGLIIDRREVGDAGTFDDMTDEELISAAARKARELGIAGPREVEDAN